MQIDFHYYATYCAAWMAGYSHEECMEICYSAQFVDCCTRTLLSTLKAPLAAATTQLQLELVDMRKDLIGLQDITRIWASFHFLPCDLYAQKKGCSRRYLNKYRLLCDVNGDLTVDTVRLAKGSSLQAAGIAMHVLADTWAHRYFAGTPSLVINNTDSHFYECVPEGDGFRRVPIVFQHTPRIEDDPDRSIYVGTPRQDSENSVLNLGHGRAGHLPDYSFMRYVYLPAWGDYREVFKDNPSDYQNAFCQMIHAMKYLRGACPSFEKGFYDTEAAGPWMEEIRTILEKRQTDSSRDWKALGERLSGRSIEDFDTARYQKEYRACPKEGREKTFLGRFFLAAMAQKSMVTNKIYRSGNLLAGFSIDFMEKGFRGIRDYMDLVQEMQKRNAEKRR